MDELERNRASWRRMAGKYDKGMRLAEKWWITGGREWVCAQATGEVLEVAIGTGLNLGHYPPGVRLTGVDFSRAMLAIAQRRADETGREVTLIEGDAQGLPFPDASFDTVVCTLGLCCVPNEWLALAEMSRVLRPGGQLLLLDHIASSNSLLRLAQRVAEQVSVRMNGDYMTRRPARLLGDAGLVIERSERLKAGTIERVRARKPV
jgi:ubiquinone/menaquinone biosynthesis C-methylase UbiE